MVKNLYSKLFFNHYSHSFTIKTLPKSGSQVWMPKINHIHVDIPYHSH